MKDINAQVMEAKKFTISGREYVVPLRSFIHKLSHGNNIRSIFLTPTSNTNIAQAGVQSGPTVFPIQPNSLIVDKIDKMTLEFTITNNSAGPLNINNFWNGIERITEDVGSSGNISSGSVSTTYYPEGLHYNELDLIDGPYDFEVVAKNIGISTTPVVGAVQPIQYYPPYYSVAAGNTLAAGASALAILNLPMPIVQTRAFCGAISAFLTYRIYWNTPLNTIGPAVTAGDISFNDIRIHVEGASYNDRVKSALMRRARQNPQIFPICYPRRYITPLTGLVSGSNITQTYISAMGQDLSIRNIFTLDTSGNNPYIPLDTLFGNSFANLYCFMQSLGRAVYNTEANSKVGWLKTLMQDANKFSPLYQTAIYDFSNCNLKRALEFGTDGAPLTVKINDTQLIGQLLPAGVPANVQWYQIALTAGIMTIDVDGSLSIKYYES